LSPFKRFSVSGYDFIHEDCPLDQLDRRALRGGVDAAAPQGVSLRAHQQPTHLA